MPYLVIGAGYTGKRICNIIHDNDGEVAGTKTSPDNSHGNYPIYEFRLGEPESIHEILDQLDWSDGDGIHLIFTAGPPRSGSHAEVVDKFQNFLEVLPQDHLESFQYLSSTSVYGDAGGNWVDETSPLQPISGSGEFKLKVENLVQDFYDDDVAVILNRPGGIYGPGRNGFERYLTDYELVNGGKKWTNRIHVEDLARASIFLSKRNEPDEVNVVDGNPVRLGELVKFVHEKAGKDPQSIKSISWEEAEKRYSDMKLGLLKTSKRVSSEKLKNMGFSFQYPKVYDGLEEIYRNSY